MTEHIMRHSTYILRHHIAATLDKGIGTSRLCKIDTSTGRATKRNHVLQLTQTITIWITGSKHNIGDVLLNLFIEIHLTNHTTGIEDLLGCRNRGHGRHLT